MWHGAAAPTPPPRTSRAGTPPGADLALAAVDARRDRPALAAGGRERVLVGTGHPTGPLAVHLAVAAALRAAGCEVLVVGPAWSLPWPQDGGPRGRW